MTDQPDIKWDVIAEIGSHAYMPCLRFVAGAKQPVLTWLVPSMDSIWTMYIAGYNPYKYNFEAPEKLKFQYLRARDIGVYIPGITPSMQLVYVQNKTILIGTRTVDDGRGVFFSADVSRREAGRPVEVDELQDADYILSSYGGSWEGIHDIFEINAQIPDPLASGQKSVYDLSAFSKNNEIFLIGSTKDAKLWFTFSSDGGESWNLPSIIAQNGIHPSITETTEGHLIAFYIREDAQIKSRKDGEKITISPAIGALWFIELEHIGEWRQPKKLIDRTDILHCSASGTGKEQFLFVAFDSYPDGTSPIVFGKDALVSGRPFSQLYIASTFDGGKTWMMPISIPKDGASYFNPEIELYENSIILSAIRREGEKWSIVSAVLPSPRELFENQ